MIDETMKNERAEKYPDSQFLTGPGYLTYPLSFVRDVA